MINQENTYLGADGLAYCKICGEPVEAFFPPDSILGMKKHFRQCACIRQKREVEEKAYKERVFFVNKKVRFALAQLGNDAGIFGAAKMVLK